MAKSKQKTLCDIFYLNFLHIKEVPVSQLWLVLSKPNLNFKSMQLGLRLIIVTSNQTYPTFILPQTFDSRFKKTWFFSANMFFFFTPLGAPPPKKKEKKKNVVACQKQEYSSWEMWGDGWLGVKTY